MNKTNLGLGIPYDLEPAKSDPSTIRCGENTPENNRAAHILLVPLNGNSLARMRLFRHVAQGADNRNPYV